MKALLKQASRKDKMRAAAKARKAFPKSERRAHARLGNALAQEGLKLRKEFNRFNANAKGPKFHVE